MVQRAGQCRCTQCAHTWGAAPRPQTAFSRSRKDPQESCYDFAFSFLPLLPLFACPVPRCPFPAVKVRLFLEAIGPLIFCSSGRLTLPAGAGPVFFSRGQGHERLKMERVSEVLQFSVIIERSGLFSIEPQPL